MKTCCAHLEEFVLDHLQLHDAHLLVVPRPHFLDFFAHKFVAERVSVTKDQIFSQDTGAPACLNAPRRVENGLGRVAWVKVFEGKARTAAGAEFRRH